MDGQLDTWHISCHTQVTFHRGADTMSMTFTDCFSLGLVFAVVLFLLLFCLCLGVCWVVFAVCFWCVWFFLLSSVERHHLTSGSLRAHEACYGTSFSCMN